AAGGKVSRATRRGQEWTPTFGARSTRPGPDAQGELTTMEGGTLKVKGSGEDYTVNDAKVVCGDIQTSNAVVYLIDGVLKPK
ncbi:fasciclin domain-containing protein, partial [Streptosporangium sp. NPDC001682]